MSYIPADRIDRLIDKRTGKPRKRIGDYTPLYRHGWARIILGLPFLALGALVILGWTRGDTPLEAFLCWKCGKAFEMGINGIKGDNGPACDKCAGIMRDDDGNFWMPDDAEIHYLEPDGKVTIVTREQAFANGGRK